jgi:apolipoprotein N-acyltransferase
MATVDRERNRDRRCAVAGWLAGLVVGLSNAWWLHTAYLALSVLLGGVVLSLTAWVGTRPRTHRGGRDG